jgi:hypothetical protein
MSRATLSAVFRGRRTPPPDPMAMQPLWPFPAARPEAGAVLRAAPDPPFCRASMPEA